MTATASTSSAPVRPVPSFFVRAVTTTAFLVGSYGTGLIAGLAEYGIDSAHATGDTNVSRLQRGYRAGAGDLFLIVVCLWLFHGLTLAVLRKSRELGVRERLVSSVTAGAMTYVLAIAGQRFLATVFANTYVPVPLVVIAFVLPAVAVTWFVVGIAHARQGR